MGLSGTWVDIDLAVILLAELRLRGHLSLDVLLILLLIFALLLAELGINHIIWRQRRNLLLLLLVVLMMLLVLGGCRSNQLGLLEKLVTLFIA